MCYGRGSDHNSGVFSSSFSSVSAAHVSKQVPKQRITTDRASEPEPRDRQPTVNQRECHRSSGFVSRLRRSGWIFDGGVPRISVLTFQLGSPTLACHYFRCFLKISLGWSKKRLPTQVGVALPAPVLKRRRFQLRKAPLTLSRRRLAGSEIHRFAPTFA